MLIKGGQILINHEFIPSDLRIVDNKIAEIGTLASLAHEEVMDATGCIIVPGFQDVHVHLREPGFAYKETIAQGAKAAAKGGYTTICTMPNLKPVPDSFANLQVQLDLIKAGACIEVIPFGAITVGEAGQELSDMEAMNPYVAGYSDDGKGVQSEAMMRKAMMHAKALNQVLSLHCEDEALVKGGYVHEGEMSSKFGYTGICSASEWKVIEREIQLAKEFDCRLHICHISTKESVELIRQAKKDGVRITCEVTPHHLVLEEWDVKEDGNFKMNPPVRSHDDRLALIDGLLDGTIDMIATDHAPHSKEEKAKGLEKSAFGIIGIEHAFGLLYTKLVMTGIIPLTLLLDKLCNGYNILKDLEKVQLAVNEKANLCIIDLNAEEVIEEETLLSTSKNTPFMHECVKGVCKATIYQGKVVYQR